VLGFKALYGASCNAKRGEDCSYTHAHAKHHCLNRHMTEQQVDKGAGMSFVLRPASQGGSVFNSVVEALSSASSSHSNVSSSFIANVLQTSCPDTQFVGEFCGPGFCKLELQAYNSQATSCIQASDRNVRAPFSSSTLAASGEHGSASFVQAPLPFHNAFPSSYLDNLEETEHAASSNLGPATLGKSSEG
jgi:hypothetical protein